MVRLSSSFLKVFDMLEKNKKYNLSINVVYISTLTTEEQANYQTPHMRYQGFFEYNGKYKPFTFVTDRIPTQQMILYGVVKEIEDGSLSFQDFCDKYGYKVITQENLNLWIACKEEKVRFYEFFGQKIAQILILSTQ